MDVEGGVADVPGSDVDDRQRAQSGSGRLERVPHRQFEEIYLAFALSIGPVAWTCGEGILELLNQRKGHGGEAHEGGGWMGRI